MEPKEMQDDQNDEGVNALNAGEGVRVRIDISPAPAATHTPAVAPPSTRHDTLHADCTLL